MYTTVGCRYYNFIYGWVRTVWGWGPLWGPRVGPLKIVPRRGIIWLSDDWVLLGVLSWRFSRGWAPSWDLRLTMLLLFEFLLYGLFNPDYEKLGSMFETLKKLSVASLTDSSLSICFNSFDKTPESKVFLFSSFYCIRLICCITNIFVSSALTFFGVC